MKKKVETAKTERIFIRVAPTVKKSFQEYCKANNTTMSKLLYAYMKEVAVRGQK